MDKSMQQLRVYLGFPVGLTKVFILDLERVLLKKKPGGKTLPHLWGTIYVGKNKSFANITIDHRSQITDYSFKNGCKI